jgi:hypothetical protein
MKLWDPLKKKNPTIKLPGDSWHVWTHQMVSEIGGNNKKDTQEQTEYWHTVTLRQWNDIEGGGESLRLCSHEQ